MRSTRAEQDAAAIDDLGRALEELDVPFERSARGVAIRIGARRVPVSLDAVAVASASSVAALVAGAAPKQLHVLVADRISRDARVALDDAGWGWLDRRGELALRVGDNYVIRSRVAPRRGPAREPARGRVRSRAGLTYLAAALERPDDSPVLRAIARRAGLSHVALSNARASLIEAGLVDENGRPVESVTFDALAESWTPEVVAVARIPRADDDVVLGVHADDPAATGWALTDTLGAIAWGARITATADYPPDFYVPTRIEFDRAVHRLERAEDFTARAATIAVAPVPFATDRRYQKPGTRWLVTHPLYAALALARDRARGPEILAEWTPTEPEGFRRSW